MSSCPDEDWLALFIPIVVIMWTFFIFWLGEKGLKEWDRQHTGEEL